MKATSLFGGVQIVNVIIQLVRSKIVAIFLGPLGMGIVGLLNSTLNIIGSTTNFGLGTSAIRDISLAESTSDEERIATIISVFRRLVWMTGILGALLTILFSNWLSKLTFGNEKYSTAFILISITLLFNQLNNGQLVLLQGLRKLKSLAKASVLGNFISLLFVAPVYYYYGIDGIVPVLIGFSVITLLVSWFYSHKITIKKINVTLSMLFTEGKGMLKMGFMINLAGFITLGIGYILKLYISRTGSIEQVGLYNAGFTLIGTYISLIITSMSKDYYPRLSAVANNKIEARKMINQQAELVILIIAPILLVLIVFLKFIIVILFSEKFLVINEMLHWAVLGVFFQVASWSMAMILLAKGASKIFLLNELIMAIYFLVINIVLYHYFDLTGLGISFLINYIIYFVQVIIVGKIFFDITLNLHFYIIFLIQLFLGLVCFFIVGKLNNNFTYLIGIFLIISSTLYSFYEINKRIDIKDIFYKKLKR